MTNYDFKKIEKKWQYFWEKDETYKVTEDESIPKEKRLYILDMFPYPSANGLHVGHPEGYTATDIFGRYKMLRGFHVLHPMGFDSFGLPAENYAIKTGSNPKKITEKNIEKFKLQIKSFGFAYDWSREIRTHDKNYYKWTQWMFLKIYEKNLAYIKEMPVWYCPELGTVLANEEVIQGTDGPRSERGFYKVEKKHLRQWILKITEYAERLLEDLKELDWPESVKEMQRNWIGKSIGAKIDFEIENLKEKIEIFTTRPDTLFGATYIVLAPDHKIIDKIVKDKYKKEIISYQESEMLKSDLEKISKKKTGIFTGTYAINPINKEKIPIWIGSYVLSSYGTGAIMGVPAHDQKDFEFALKYDLPIKQVVSKDGTCKTLASAFTEDGISTNCGDKFSGLKTDKMKEKVLNWLIKNQKGEKRVSYKIRDWIFSRQRYWGEPIPIMFDKNENIIPLKEDELPLTLPEIKKYIPSGTGESPLAKVEEWVNAKVNNKKLRRETNTMPQWAGSCWYYLRYLDPNNDKEFANKKKIEYWMPVDLYIGGTEHSVLHLLYARFWHKIFYDLGYLNTKEPFKKLVNQGMITSFAYQDENGTFVPNDEVYKKNNEFFRKKDNKKLKQITAKMSKSLKNIVNPSNIINKYGADSIRLYEMFMGPITDSKPWNTKGLIGIFRFLNKVWSLKEKKLTKDEPTKELISKLHKTIKKVTEDTESLSFNTAISTMMIFVNELLKYNQNYLSIFKSFILLLAPYAPHLSEELWEYIKEKSSIFKNGVWPKYDLNLIIDDTKEIVLQINSKIKDKIKLKKNTTEEDLKEIALKNNKIKLSILNKEIKKIIIVKNKLVNIVIK